MVAMDTSRLGVRSPTSQRVAVAARCRRGVARTADGAVAFSFYRSDRPAQIILLTVGPWTAR